ncbi:ral guanine nucleotide dissociation stimulator-like isoform X2 [Myotis daubentonii]|uniref:ral guanine nucleotide dissociation stimulator-like isoform X2 n=1 Tax=Myotis daubentonii TaxID=98922 RepID=UPI002872CD92|nr:ral guanine nucleotide dissociation stimulator-like isoform X2 [Myotis daubentonii]
MVPTARAHRLAKLVEYLVPAFLGRDPTFVPTFLWSYRAFATTQQVLDLLLTRYGCIFPYAEEDGGPVDQQKKAIISILGMWLDQFPQDFFQPPDFPGLVTLLAYLELNFPGSALERQAQLLLSEPESREPTDAEAEGEEDSEPESREPTDAEGEEDSELERREPTDAEAEGEEARSRRAGSPQTRRVRRTRSRRAGSPQTRRVRRTRSWSAASPQTRRVRRTRSWSAASPQTRRVRRTRSWSAASPQTRRRRNQLQSQIKKDLRRQRRHPWPLRSQSGLRAQLSLTFTRQKNHLLRVGRSPQLLRGLWSPVLGCSLCSCHGRGGSPCRSPL